MYTNWHGRLKTPLGKWKGLVSLVVPLSVSLSHCCDKLHSTSIHIKGFLRISQQEHISQTLDLFYFFSFVEIGGKISSCLCMYSLLGMNTHSYSKIVIFFRLLLPWGCILRPHFGVLVQFCVIIILHIFA